MTPSVAEGIAGALAVGDVHGAQTALLDALAKGTPPAAQLMDDMAAQLPGIAHPVARAFMATFAGAVGERSRAPPEAAKGLARAIIAPIAEALAAAQPVLLEADAEGGHGHAPGDDDNDHGHSHDHGHAHGGNSHGSMLAQANADAVDRWYLPAAMAWGRCPDVLKEAQANTALRAALAAVPSEASVGTSWLNKLLKTVLDEPVVVLVPELGEGFDMRVNGVVDMGQMYVLLTPSLRDALVRIGSTAPDTVSPAAIAGVSNAPEADDPSGVSVVCDFHLWPWQALDPADGLPKRGRFMWSSPGGRGDHSLPVDSLLGDIVPVKDGVRVLVLVGPKAPSFINFSRTFPGNRPFNGLHARIDDVRPLTREAYQGWVDKIVAHLPAVAAA